MPSPSLEIQTITDQRPNDPLNPAFWEAPPWPDGMPSVSMDINLGMDYRYIHFDPYSYAGLLNVVGVKPTDYSKLDIEIKRGQPSDEELMRTKGLTLGQYSPIRHSGGSGKISIFLDKELGLDQDKSNPTLIHETQHFVDDLSGELHRKPSRTEREKSIGKRIGMRLVGIKDHGHAEARADATMNKHKHDIKHGHIIRTYR